REVEEALRAGVAYVGHNYVQEAEQMIPLIAEVPQLGDKVRWHMIGHLQKNKVKKAVRLFDMIETVDSWPLAKLIDRRCAAIGLTMPVLVEVNIGREASKSGVLPEEVDDLVRRLGDLKHIRVQGLMTMGPRFGDPEDARPYFRATKEAFDRLARADLPNVEMRTLSMGMSNSYQVALEEGANMVRLGTVLFGEREP
ncbi:MAG: YggS family pyridoxal phosphate-dependent enzyme, partial [Armatimonadetes bacterium]|nr:YggS family pyridoxal phosphate-dependent enzyme [Armatimonadota bacterium]NIO96427.1 YggS family pyridoxal phosphate-dependent enzyme [Armatimonadota bacterium]